VPESGLRNLETNCSERVFLGIGKDVRGEDSGAIIVHSQKQGST
jgi:hypothetical protein